MRRGRIFIYLALIIIVVLVGAFFYFKPKLGGANPSVAQTQTAAVKMVPVVFAAKPIAAGAQITEDMLTSSQLPEQSLPQGIFTDLREVIGQFAKVSIPAATPITANELSATAGNINLPGSSWSTYIPQGLTAVSIPVSRLSAAAYGIRDGDYVDVIASILLLDVDPQDQTALPDKVAGFVSDKQEINGFTAPDIHVGFYQAEEIPNAVDYIYPSEDQRPRMVSQMVMQNIQVLHVGSFPLPGEPNADELNAQPQVVATPQATPAGGNAQQPSVIVVVKPDIITLMVSPQDAVTLTYLVFSKAQITLTLRNPNDQDTSAQPDAAMLEYLLTQYNIPVPAKLPYSTNPRLDTLVQPTLTNDVPAP